MDRKALESELQLLRTRRALLSEKDPTGIWDNLISVIEALLKGTEAESTQTGRNKASLEKLRDRLRSTPAPGGAGVTVLDLQTVINYLLSEEDIEENVQDTQDYGRSVSYESHKIMEGADNLRLAMINRLFRKAREGRYGWYDSTVISTKALASMLRDSVRKGDPVDVANYAMMLYNRGGRTNEGVKQTESQEVACVYMRLPDSPTLGWIWWSTRHQRTVVFPMEDFSNCPYCGAGLDLRYEWQHGLPGVSNPLGHK